MAKVVQTSLEEEEYRVFRDLLEKRKLSIREGLRKAVTRMLEEEVRVDPKDPFLVVGPVGGAGLETCLGSMTSTCTGRRRVAPLHRHRRAGCARGLR